MDKPKYVKSRPNKRQRTSVSNIHDLKPRIPSFDASTEWSQALAAYKKWRVVLLRNADKGIGNASQQTIQAKDVFNTLHTLASEAPPGLIETWSLEHATTSNKSTTSSKSESVQNVFLPTDVLCQHPRSIHENNQLRSKRQWYCSFILKSKDIVSSLLPSLPVSILPNDIQIDNDNNNQDNNNKDTSTTIQHGNAVWFFIGRNKARTGLLGRPEHTDSVRHDGTWHYQVSGNKIWHLRPTEDLCNTEHYLNQSKSKSKSSTTFTWTDSVRLDINVSAGDVLLVDTAKWWHQTELPNTLNAEEEISMSYARDIYLDGNPFLDDDNTEDDMTNVDWLYAPHNIEKGTVVLTEDDIPDAAFPESEYPNCDVVEDETTGKMVVIANQNIKQGDFFSVEIGSDDENCCQDDDCNGCDDGFQGP